MCAGRPAAPRARSALHAPARSAAATDPSSRALLNVPTEAQTGGPVRLSATVDGEQPPGGYRYRRHFGDGTQLETSEATTTHVFDREGPCLPRLVMTGQDGRQVLTEAAEAVTVD
ncbi:PKD domain-containing protein [Streptomyces lunaelactis]|uniref:PKD domain-containing protein n=1 Tax=Streptomyces lunaelactis TaxID=1535768 RepID=UPI003529DE41